LIVPAFAISEAPIDPVCLREAMQAPQCGAFVCFEGWVRDSHQGKSVRALDYQAYRELALSEGERIMHEACARFDIVGATAVHRVGALALGDLAVWVGVSAGHRDAAFAACRWVIDEIKARVPIWKREHYRDGVSEWLHP
jgi:molybdopterin synthase catalytic subunit